MNPPDPPARPSGGLGVAGRWRLPITVLLVAAGLGTGRTGAQDAASGPESRTELFHVSRVGTSGAAETRETLLDLYESVSTDYNEKLRAEQASNPQLFRGERVRVLRDLAPAPGGGGRLFLVAYNGGPTVFAVTGDAGDFEPGKLSPPLVIGEPDGEHPVEITRMVTVTDPARTEPQLETVDEEDGGAVTFFGIPIPGTGSKATGGGGGGKGAVSTKGGGTRREEVTETRSLPRYAATVSRERLDGGPDAMSTPLFVSQLKNGEVFTVTRPELRRCQGCRGFGRVTTTKPPGFRDPDGKMECPDCRGIGKIDWVITYQVVW